MFCYFKHYYYICNIKNRNKMKKKVEEAMTVEGIMEEYEVNRRLAMYVLEERIARQKDKEQKRKIREQNKNINNK